MLGGFPSSQASGPELEAYKNEAVDGMHADSTGRHDARRRNIVARSGVVIGVGGFLTFLAVAAAPFLRRLAPSSQADATLSAETERENLIGLLTGAGDLVGNPPWREAADSVFVKIRSAIPVDSNITVSGLACFQNGCRFDLRATNATEFAAIDKAVLGGQDILLFPGAKIRTAPQRQPDGSLQTAVILYRPEL